MKTIESSDCCLSVTVSMSDDAFPARVTRQDVGYGQEEITVSHAGLHVSFVNYKERHRFDDSIDIVVLPPREEEASP